MLLVGLRCHDTHTKFYEDRYRYSEVTKRGIYIQIHRQQGDLISLLYFLLQNEENMLQMGTETLHILSQVHLIDHSLPTLQ
jgi:hypothetical protein